MWPHKIGEAVTLFVTIIVVSLAAIRLVRDERIELPALAESKRCSTAELITHLIG